MLNTWSRWTCTRYIHEDYLKIIPIFMSYMWTWTCSLSGRLPEYITQVTPVPGAMLVSAAFSHTYPCCWWELHTWHTSETWLDEHTVLPYTLVSSQILQWVYLPLSCRHGEVMRAAIILLVSRWPFDTISVRDVIPDGKLDMERMQEGHTMSLLHMLMEGFLSLTPDCKLRTVDFRDAAMSSKYFLFFHTCKFYRINISLL